MKGAFAMKMNIPSKQKIRLSRHGIRTLLSNHASKGTLKVYLCLLTYASIYEESDTSKRSRYVNSKNPILIMPSVNLKAISKNCHITVKTVKHSISYLEKLGFLIPGNMPNTHRKNQICSIILNDYYTIFQSYANGGNGGYRDTDRSIIRILLNHKNVNALRLDLANLMDDKESSLHIIKNKREVFDISSSLRSKKYRDSISSDLFNNKVKKDYSVFKLNKQYSKTQLQLKEYKSCKHKVSVLDRMVDNRISKNIGSQLVAITKLAEVHSSDRVLQALIYVYENYIVPNSEYLLPTEQRKLYKKNENSREYFDLVSHLCSSLPYSLA